MHLEEAKVALREAHLQAGFALIGEEPDELLLEAHSNTFSIPVEQIDRFARHQDALAARDIIHHGSGFASSNSIETALVPVGETVRGAGFDEVTFGDPNGPAPFGRVGPASNDFLVAYQLNTAFLLQAYRRARFPRLAQADEGKGAPLPPYPRPITIQLYNLPSRSPDQTLKDTEHLVGSCLYFVASANQVVLRPPPKWPRPPSTQESQRFVYEENEDETTFAFPKALFNPDLIRFYALGMSSDVPEMQFLAFYQILEYFFVAVSDDKLYSQLARRLNDPTFKLAPAWLDRLIKDVSDHKGMTDETEMLKLVINRYVGHGDILAFLDRYHEAVDSKFYAAKRQRFGTEFAINRELNHTVGDVARILKAVRNALVHSSDRHERNQRHIPFSESSEVVRYEVPLVRFLAERVIIGSAQPLD